MKVTAEQIPNTIRFLQIDFPALILQTGIPEDGDEYWRDLMEKADVISKNYGGDNTFINHILTSYCDYLEKMRKKAKLLEKERKRGEANEQNERI